VTLPEPCNPRGSLNKITNSTQITNYTLRQAQGGAYNAADQLSNVVFPNNTNITYGYDADGRRVKQTVGSTVTNYQWDEASPYGDVVSEYNSSGSTLASYIAESFDRRSPFSQEHNRSGYLHSLRSAPRGDLG